MSRNEAQEVCCMHLLAKQSVLEQHDLTQCLPHGCLQVCDQS